MPIFKNPSRHPPSPDALTFVGTNAPAAVMAYLSQCPIYMPTPLHSLMGLARKLGVGAIHYKDESRRLGLQSFKALGGAYAIMEILRRHAAVQLHRDVGPDNLFDDDVRRIAGTMTFVCASDGNHGRSVAAGARLVGSKCVVLVHGGVSETRVQWIRNLGGDVQRIDGSYDRSVELAREKAERNRWVLVSDTAVSDADDVPGLIMQGYTVIADEVLVQLKQRGTLPTHIFVQAGVGGLAAAMAGHLAARLGTKAPRVVVVEPENANCLYESAHSGQLVEIAYKGPTVYAMLECNRPSSLAWTILSQCSDFFMTIPDEMAARAMRALAFPTDSDPALIAGESGAAGLAGLMKACSVMDDARNLGLSSKSELLLIGTEGATDAKTYEQLVGVSPENVGTEPVTR